MTCPTCGNLTYAGAKSCSRCGAPLEPPAPGVEMTVDRSSLEETSISNHALDYRQREPAPFAAQSLDEQAGYAAPQLSDQQAGYAAPQPSDQQWGYDQHPIYGEPPVYPPQAPFGGYPYQPGDPYQPGHPPQTTNSDQGRALLAHLVLWGGLALATYIVATVDWFRGTYYEGYVAGGLNLGLNAGPRIATLGLLALPFVLAVLIVPSDAARRGAATFAVFVAATLDYVFTYSESKAAWLVVVAVDVTLLAGWLAARGRPARSLSMLVLAAGVSALWEMPGNPGLWLRSVPVRLHWHSAAAYAQWNNAGLVLVGLVGLLAYAVGRTDLRPPSPALVWGTVGSASVACLLVGVLVATAFKPASYKYNHQSAPSDPAGSSSISAGQAQALAGSAMQDLETGSGAQNCDGSRLPSPDISSYSIDDVSPQTSGSFLVHAAVTLTNGGTEVVDFLVGAASQTSVCVDSASPSGVANGGSSSPSPSPAPSEPTDVPSIPSNSDPVPTGATPPGSVQNPTVVSYTDSGTTPTTPGELVEYQPSGLDSDKLSAVQAVIGFLTYINQQDFQHAWNQTTGTLVQLAPSAGFERGYRTSRHYQVAFGQPQVLTSTLIAIPARFVSRQDPGAQGNPAGVTDCTYWPQYVFLVANVNGTWLDDVAGKFTDDPSVATLKRADAVRGGKPELDPLSQRVSC